MVDVATTTADGKAPVPKKLRRLLEDGPEDMLDLDINPFADRLAFAPTFIGGYCPRQHDGEEEEDQRYLQLVDEVTGVVEDVVDVVTPGGGEDGTSEGGGGGSLPAIPGVGILTPSDSVLDEIGIGTRNITATNFTVNAGLWKYGIFVIDGQCHPMHEANAPPPEPSLKAARAMAIIASISGFAGIVLAMSNCHMDDKTRRRRNKYVAVLYMLAALSTWLTFLIHNITACQGKQRRWDEGLLEGLVLLYGKCQCRVGCFLTIVAGCCYLIAVVTVLIYTG